LHKPNGMSGAVKGVAVTLFKFRALVDFDPVAAGTPARAFHSGTCALTVHATHIGEPRGDRYLQAMMTWDDQQDRWPGDHAIVTITVADQKATEYLAAGQRFTLWGGGSGHGIVSRQVFTDGSPS
jgi:hypothetical protein